VSLTDCRRCALKSLTCGDSVSSVDKLLRVTTLRAAAAGGVAAVLSLAAVPGARAAVAGAVGPPVRGLDISAFQHAGTPIDWGLLARQGDRFVAIKVTEGTYYRNPYYPSDARAAAAVGLRVMPYVFADPDRGGGRATASYAVGAAGTPRGPGRLPLVVDLENDPYTKVTDCYGLGIQAMIAWIASFTARAEALTGKWPVIYTTAAWWQECTGSTGRFRRDPLWLAAFDGTLPTVPSPWPHWTFWQYDNEGVVPGIGQTDLDYYQPTTGLPALRAPAKPLSKNKSKHKQHPKTKRHPKHKQHPKTKRHPKHKRHPKPKQRSKSRHKKHAKRKSQPRPKKRERRGSGPAR
jgi:GH25 family lysozyme M1 (1,4-beta-N-acetylmuramidase)